MYQNRMRAEIPQVLYIKRGTGKGTDYFLSKYEHKPIHLLNLFNIYIYL